MLSVAGEGSTDVAALKAGALHEMAMYYRSGIRPTLTNSNWDATVKERPALSASCPVPRSIAAGRRTGAAEAVRCGSDSAELALLELPL